ncbi:hypothetical protein SAMN04487846_2169 [Microbacterium sp. cf046]|uniref:hypothetical protein n=1 Tax=Microbacterium sp. cf046 TaxID=1761803 RepID=UPI0008E71B86|nr:hypothetical protein [Microbacterium sp. cf046]SFS06928.1 hypothetical protein SAMN04487846_2169 [Microbacterium sp. cf046]
MYPASSSDSEVGGPSGHTYGAAIVPADELTADELQGVLSEIRFSGWIAPAEDGWCVVLGDPGGGVVADGRRGIIEVAEVIAARVTGPVLAVRVLHDRQLALVAWHEGEEVARYCSDPSREPGARKDVLSEPIGAESAAVFAELWKRPDDAEKLTELLEDEIDPDSVYESERVGKTLRMLGLPAWIVAAGAGPRSMPTGPKASELVHLRAGLPGVAGRSRDALVRPIRRRQIPPPVIEDPPSGSGMDAESWMF